MTHRRPFRTLVLTAFLVGGFGLGFPQDSSGGETPLTLDDFETVVVEGTVAGKPAKAVGVVLKKDKLLSLSDLGKRSYFYYNFENDKKRDNGNGFDGDFEKFPDLENKDTLKYWLINVRKLNTSDAEKSQEEILEIFNNESITSNYYLEYNFIEQKSFALFIHNYFDNSKNRMIRKEKKDDVFDIEEVLTQLCYGGVIDFDYSVLKFDFLTMKNNGKNYPDFLNSFPKAIGELQDSKINKILTDKGFNQAEQETFLSIMNPFMDPKERINKFETLQTKISSGKIGAREIIKNALLVLCGLILALLSCFFIRNYLSKNNNFIRMLSKIVLNKIALHLNKHFGGKKVSLVKYLKKHESLKESFNEFESDLELKKFKNEMKMVYESFIDEPVLDNARVPTFEKIAKKIDNIPINSMDSTLKELKRYIQDDLPKEVASVFLLKSPEKVMLGQLLNINEHLKKNITPARTHLSQIEETLLKFLENKTAPSKALPEEVENTLSFYFSEVEASERYKKLKFFLNKFSDLLAISINDPVDQTTQNSSEEWRAPESNCDEKPGNMAEKEGPQPISVLKVLERVEVKLANHRKWESQIEDLALFLPGDQKDFLGDLARNLEDFSGYFSSQDLPGMLKELGDFRYRVQALVRRVQSAAPLMGDANSPARDTLATWQARIEQYFDSVQSSIKAKATIDNLVYKLDPDCEDTTTFLKKSLGFLNTSRTAVLAFAKNQALPQVIWEKTVTILEGLLQLGLGYPSSDDTVPGISGAKTNSTPEERFRIVSAELRFSEIMRKDLDSVEELLALSNTKTLTTFSQYLNQIANHFGTKDFSQIATVLESLNRTLLKLQDSRQKNLKLLQHPEVIESRIAALLRNEFEWQSLEKQYAGFYQSGESLGNYVRRQKDIADRFAAFGEKVAGGKTDLSQLAEWIENHLRQCEIMLRHYGRMGSGERFNFETFLKFLKDVLEENQNVEGLVADKKAELAKTQEVLQRTQTSRSQILKYLGIEDAIWEEETKSLAKCLTELHQFIGGEAGTAKSPKDAALLSRSQLHQLRTELASLGAMDPKLSLVAATQWAIYLGNQLQTLAGNLLQDLGFKSPDLGEPERVAALVKTCEVEKTNDVGPLRLALAGAMVCWSRAMEVLEVNGAQDLADNLGMNPIRDSLTELIQKLETTQADRLWQDAIALGFAKGALNQLLRASLVLDTFYRDKPDFAYVLQAVRLASDAIQTAVAPVKVRFVRLELLRDSLNEELMESIGPVDEAYCRIEHIRKVVNETLDRGKVGFLVDIPKWPIHLGPKLSKGKVAIVHPGQWRGGVRS